MKDKDEEYDFIKMLVDNSEHETFITKEDMYPICDNSDRTYTQLLMNTDRNFISGRPQRETSVPMRDGNVLKITPIFSGNTIKYYILKVYKGEELFNMFSMTSEFREYARQYSELRSSMIELASVSAAAGVDMEELGMQDLLSSLSNKTAIFAMLTADSRLPCVSVTDALTRLCGKYQNLLRTKKSAEIVTAIDKDLYCRINKSGMNFAVTNILSNAILYCDAKEKIVHVTASKNGEEVVIEISDNGHSADLQRIESFRGAFSSAEREENSEGLGIAIAELFAARSRGRLELENSATGGLTARIILPCCDPVREISLNSPTTFIDEEDILRDIMLKGSNAELLKNFSLPDYYER